jgi:hypothetical protein
LVTNVATALSRGANSQYPAIAKAIAAIATNRIRREAIFICHADKQAPASNVPAMRGTMFLSEQNC